MPDTILPSHATWESVRELAADHPAGLLHDLRFRSVANRYPRVVTFAYAGDLAAAMRDTDEQVAATVAAWERNQGVRVRDWRAIGVAERGDAGEAVSA